MPVMFEFKRDTLQLMGIVMAQGGNSAEMVGQAH
jgi:hypothetical protein